MRKTRSLQAQLAAKQISPLGLAAFLGFLILGSILAVSLRNAGQPDAVSGGALIISLLPGLYILFALRMASEWEKAVVLRAGKFMGLRGPGLFWLVPVVDSIPVWIDHRVMVTPFNAEKTLTKEATQ
jgi:regulator of protease activity HflC (stomatin/prohibitin superfamily)